MEQTFLNFTKGFIAKNLIKAKEVYGKIDHISLAGIIYYESILNKTHSNKSRYLSTLSIWMSENNEIFNHISNCYIPSVNYNYHPDIFWGHMVKWGMENLLKKSETLNQLNQSNEMFDFHVIDGIIKDIDSMQEFGPIAEPSFVGCSGYFF